MGRNVRVNDRPCRIYPPPPNVHLGWDSSLFEESANGRVVTLVISYSAADSCHAVRGDSAAYIVHIHQCNVDLLAVFLSLRESTENLIPRTNTDSKRIDPIRSFAGMWILRPGKCQDRRFVISPSFDSTLHGDLIGVDPAGV